MGLSIVIVNWNVKDLLRDCLHSLLDACQAASKLDIEIIVVDSDSTDGSPQMVSDEFPHSKLKKHKIPYNFCESCKEEYLDYIDRLRGGGNPEYYWHNENWLDIWQKWIDYQHTIDCYLKSKEFNRLLQELKQPEPNP